MQRIDEVLPTVAPELPSAAPPTRRGCVLCGGRFESIYPHRRVCDGCIAAVERRAMQEDLERAIGTIPNRGRWARFTSPELPGRVRPSSAIEQASEAQQRLAEGTAHIVVLIGPSGAGKTTLANCIFRRLIETSAKPTRGAAWWAASYVGRAPTESPMGSEAPGVRRCREGSVIVLDDMGAEVDRTAQREASGIVGDVLRERVDEGRCTIVTTFLEQDRIVARYGDGVCRRLFSGLVVRLGGA